MATEQLSLRLLRVAAKRQCRIHIRVQALAVRCVVAALAFTAGCRTKQVQTTTIHQTAGSNATGGVTAAVSAPNAAAATAPLKVHKLTTPADAIAILLAEKPRVLAFGESHAPRDLEQIESATVRFQRDLLPRLAPAASALVIELWVANPDCKRAAVAEVQKRQAPITAPQRKSNGNEFFRLGEASKALGVMPFALVPACEAYDQIADAGEHDVLAMLEQVARTTEKALRTRLDAKPGALVLAYGGALHNDLVPRAGWAATSYAPAIDAATGGHLVECDLVVPEFVQDTPAWQAQPWYRALREHGGADQPVLLEYANRRFALVFARTAAR